MLKGITSTASALPTHLIIAQLITISLGKR